MAQPLPGAEGGPGRAVTIAVAVTGLWQLTPWPGLTVLGGPLAPAPPVGRSGQQVQSMGAVSGTGGSLQGAQVQDLCECLM